MSRMADLDAQLRDAGMVAVADHDAFVALTTMYDSVRDMTDVSYPFSRFTLQLCESVISAMTAIRYALQMNDVETFDYCTEASRRVSLALGRLEIQELLRPMGTL